MSTFTNLRVHFIWSTKDREPLIREEFQADLYAYIGGILRECRHVLLRSGGVADHIHLLVGMHPQQSISDLVRDVKSNSSIWIHNNQPKLGGFAWQTGYGAFSVSQSAVPQVNQYIDNQKDHHMTVSFKTEFITFLKRHDIEYNEAYIWEWPYHRSWKAKPPKLYGKPPELLLRVCGSPTIHKLSCGSLFLFHDPQMEPTVADDAQSGPGVISGFVIN